MAIEWLAGNRLRGTTAERPSGDVLSSPSVGGWKEVGRTTVASNGDSLDVSSLTNKRYYMVLLDHQANGSSQPNARFNSDSGSNYCYRWNNDGSDGTGVNKTNMKTANGWNTSEYGVWYISNLAGKQKASFYQCTTDRGSGAGTVPSRSMTGNMWTSTNAINSINFIQGGGGGSFGAGSECIVLGYDPADTHTDNFWEELSSVTTTSSGTIDSGTITAKRYLMYSIIGKKASGTGTESARFRFNGDTGSNYAQRNAINGTHYTYGNQTSANIGGDGNTAGEMVFLTGFIVNVASREKFWFGNATFGNSSGAGQIGNRGDISCKWANTSAQITSIECMGTTFEAGAKMMIWGSD